MEKAPRQLSPLEIKLNDLAKRLTRIPLSQKIFFVDNLRTMVKAGLSLVDALDILDKEMHNKRLKEMVGKIRENVEKGKPLSESLALYPKAFPSIYVKMIAAGELAGKLDESLDQTVTQMKKSNELLSSIRGAMIYPAVILTAMGAVGILMTTVILPKLLEIFKDFDAELPLPTRILIALVNFTSKPLNIVLIILAVTGIVSGYIYLMRHNLSFKRSVHNTILHLPIFGAIVKEVNLAKFTLTLSSLLRSTISIIDAVEISGDTCSNIKFREALHDAAAKIKTGVPLSDVLRASPQLFPPMVTEMIMVGERTGEVDHLLQELSEYYGDSIDKTMKNFSTIIEPVIILMLGIAVAGIAVAVVMPMYSLVQNF